MPKSSRFRRFFMSDRQRAIEDLADSPLLLRSVLLYLPPPELIGTVLLRWWSAVWPYVAEAAAICLFVYSITELRRQGYLELGVAGLTAVTCLLGNILSYKSYKSFRGHSLQGSETKLLSFEDVDPVEAAFSGLGYALGAFWVACVGLFVVGLAVYFVGRLFGIIPA